MSILSNIRDRIEKEKKNFRFKQQINSELKARDLETKAKFSKALGDRLERQEKARKIIDKTKSIQRKQTQDKIKRVLAPSQQQKKQNKPKDMDFFGSTANKNKKKSKKSNDDFFKL